MERRLVLNNRTETEITDNEMSGWFHQQLKFYKFRRVPTKTGKSIFYLFFRTEEDTYAALRAAKSMKQISIVRYRPYKPIDIDVESSYRPSAPDTIINLCRYSFRKHVNKFLNVV